MSELVKLNFGSGSIIHEDWVNVDMEDHGQAHVGSTELFPDNHFDCIVAHCSIQMNEWHSIPALLKDLHRILKPGGVLRISLPDILKGFRAYNANNTSFFPNGELDIDERFSAWLLWYSTTKTLLTQKALGRFLLVAGFNNVDITDFKKTFLYSEDITELDARNHECFFVDARK